MIHVFIDPDGTLSGSYGVLLVVKSRTGIVYHTQCGGLASKERAVEGFLIPVGSKAKAEALRLVFQPYPFFDSEANSSPDQLMEVTRKLQSIVTTITCFYGDPSNDADYHLAPLTLDLNTMDECLEAWIPVTSPFGAGFLTTLNSD